METEKKCPSCGKPLDEKALGGLCPACLLNVSVTLNPESEGDASATQTTSSAGRNRPPLPLEQGTIFGRYRIGRRLGHGGMGVVYEAEELDSGRRVALKVIQQKLSSPHDRKRFLREGRLAASINHPNCVYVFGTEEIDDIPVIAMEYVAGGTLEKRLRREGALPVAAAVDAVLEVIDGLEAAHAKGILHRDIKPSNCFEDETGRIKIGDFGLSISTVPRAETLITETRALLGTPSYCPPEQLRGEELDTRTDMYAVGVMLFQLLTERLPFEGKSMPQLIANTLEKHAPSPRQYRKDIPAGLAKIILRCLEKQPSDRYRSYTDLRRALTPYSSDAPTPATLGLRFLAGILDQLFISVFSQAAMVLLFGSPFVLINRMQESPADAWRVMLPAFSFVMAYYSVSEWRWGASLGKAICRLKVIRPHGGYPHLGQTCIRAACYVLLPVIPSWIIAAGDPMVLAKPSLTNSLLSFIFFFVTALLFVTARRRNGFAAFHDLVTGTRIVSRTALATRLDLAPALAAPPTPESSPRIGPYHVLKPLGQIEGTEWVEGYDLQLLRRVMIRKVPPNTPPWPGHLCPIARVGRLRWLTGRRDASENWDAFEGLGGQALLDLATTAQPWAQVRFWLYDLAHELAAAEKNGTLPAVLALDRVWITEQGRAKLLDSPAPHQAASSSYPCESPVAFINLVARTALLGRGVDTLDTNVVSTPLPMHAQTFLTTLPTLSDPTTVAQALTPLLRRPAVVTKKRRAMVVAGCVAIPLMLSLGMMLVFHMVRKMESKQPGLTELTRVLRRWESFNHSWVPIKNTMPEDDARIYIAAHYRDVINDESVWESGYAQTMITDRARAFAESSLSQYPTVSPEEQTRAETALEPFLKHRPEVEAMHPKFAVFIWAGILIFYVVIPALIAALLFRGGLVLRACSVTFVRRDGRPAARLRLFWRAIVAWGPVMLTTFSLSLIVGPMESVLVPTLAVSSLCTLTITSLLLPVRGLPDRLAGTWPVIR